MGMPWPSTEKPGVCPKVAVERYFSAMNGCNPTRKMEQKRPEQRSPPVVVSVAHTPHALIRNLGDQVLHRRKRLGKREAPRKRRSPSFQKTVLA
jgi:hypothetical protein